MVFCNSFSSLSCSFCHSWKTSKKPFFPKHFIAHLKYIINLIIINTNKNHTIIRQQIPCNFQARINHIQPVGVKTSVAFGVLGEAVAVFVQLAAHFIPFVGADAEFIVIHKVVTCVVGRINVYHFDFAEIGFLQQL